MTGAAPQTVSRDADRARESRIRKRPNGPAGKAQRDRGAADGGGMNRVLALSTWLTVNFHA